VRVASKSVRCRYVLDVALATPGFAGIMAYSLREALWLVSCGVTDVLIGYPTADRGALRDLAADPAALAAITLMVDGGEQLELIASVIGTTPVRVCLDVDASLADRTPPTSASAARHCAPRPTRRRSLMLLPDVGSTSSGSCSTRLRSRDCLIRQLRSGL